MRANIGLASIATKARGFDSHRGQAKFFPIRCGHILREHYSPLYIMAISTEQNNLGPT